MQTQKDILKEISQSTFIVKDELDRIKELEKQLKYDLGDTNLFMFFSDCDQLRRKLRVISSSFFDNILDIKTFIKSNK